MVQVSKEFNHLAIVNLDKLTSQGGIGRVIANLQSFWHKDLKLSNASFTSVPLPILRNLPNGIQRSPEAQCVLLPQLTGASALRSVNKIPSVVIVHDIGIVDFVADNDNRDYLSQYIVKQSFKKLNLASHVVTVSEFSKKKLLTFLPELSGRVTTISNGVDTQFLSYKKSVDGAKLDLKSLLGISLRGPLLIYVGSEIKRKNFPFLLDVMSELKSYYPDIQLLKIGKAGGEKWREQSLLEMKKRKLIQGQDVLFLEGLSDQHLADCYRAADLFVSPSLYEGFGLPVLESMAIGTPVVVTNKAAFPEVCGAVGCAVTPELSVFCQAIQGAIENPVSEDELRSYASAFSWNKSAESYLDLMRSLA